MFKKYALYNAMKRSSSEDLETREFAGGESKSERNRELAPEQPS